MLLWLCFLRLLSRSNVSLRTTFCRCTSFVFDLGYRSYIHWIRWGWGDFWFMVLWEKRQLLATLWQSMQYHQIYQKSWTLEGQLDNSSCEVSAGSSCHQCFYSGLQCSIIKLGWYCFFCEHELMFMFNIIVNPSICHLSVVCLCNVCAPAEGHCRCQNATAAVFLQPMLLS